MNIMTTEAELFTIRYGINQATSISDITKIVVITDSLYMSDIWSLNTSFFI